MKEAAAAAHFHHDFVQCIKAEHEATLNAWLACCFRYSINELVSMPCPGRHCSAHIALQYSGAIRFQSRRFKWTTSSRAAA
jgi:hypothetical protein